MSNLCLVFSFIFIHTLFNGRLQFMAMGLHILLGLINLLDERFVGFIHRKKLLNYNNNNILLL